MLSIKFVTAKPAMAKHNATNINIMYIYRIYIIIITENKCPLAYTAK